MFGKKIVKNEYEKYKFSKRTKKSFEEYATLIFAIFFVIMAFIGLLIQESRPDIMNFVFISVVVGFFAMYEIYIFKGIKLIITRKFEEKKLEQYTVKGAKEYIRWQRFIKFIKEYTLIEEQQLDSVVVLRKYLSYSMALSINTNYNSEILYKLMGKHVFDTKEFFVLWLNNRF